MNNMSKGSGLGVNVDVANTAFWNTMGTLADTARAMLSNPQAQNEKQLRTSTISFFHLYSFANSYL